MFHIPLPNWLQLENVNIFISLGKASARTVSLICHASKILTLIILKKIEPKIDDVDGKSVWLQKRKRDM